jgi:hypothetical protein
MAKRSLSRDVWARIGPPITTGQNKQATARAEVDVPMERSAYKPQKAMNVRKPADRIRGPETVTLKQDRPATRIEGRSTRQAWDS